MKEYISLAAQHYICCYRRGVYILTKLIIAHSLRNFLFTNQNMILFIFFLQSPKSAISLHRAKEDAQKKQMKIGKFYFPSGKPRLAGMLCHY